LRTARAGSAKYSIAGIEGLRVGDDETRAGRRLQLGAVDDRRRDIDADDPAVARRVEATGEQALAAPELEDRAPIREAVAVPGDDAEAWQLEVRCEVVPVAASMLGVEDLRATASRSVRNDT
jgi:hypothetical protein